MRIRRFGPRHCAVVLFAAALAALPCRADIVVLRNGRRIEGRVEIADDVVRIVTGDGRTVTVTRAEVDRVLKSGAGRVKDFKITDDLRRRVEQQKHLNTLGAALRGGGKTAARAAKELREAGPDALPQLAAALDGKNDAAAGLALRALGAVGGRAAADGIAARLATLKPELQALALEQLGAIHSVHAVPAIAGLLRRDDVKPEVRRAAVAALGRLHNDLAIPVLIRALTKRETRAIAADALLALDSAAALPYLERLVIRRGPAAGAAAAIICKTVRPEHVRLLLRLRQSADARARDAGASALRRLKDSKTCRVAAFVALLGSADPAERGKAAAWLAKATGGREKGPKEWLSWWMEQNAGRARIAVLSFGNLDAAVARHVARKLEAVTGVKATIPAALSLPRWSRMPGSTRFRADALLDHVERWLRQNPQAIVAVGVVPVQIELPGSGPVLGAFRHGRCGVVSLPALGAGKNPKRLGARLDKYSAHVLARALRITGAEEPLCPAAAVYEAADLDAMQDTFSGPTADRLKKSIDVSVSVLAGELPSAIRELTRLKDFTDAGELGMELAFLAERHLDLDLARRLWTEAAKRPENDGEKALIEARIRLIEELAGDKAEGR